MMLKKYSKTVFTVALLLRMKSTPKAEN